MTDLFIERAFVFLRYVGEIGSARAECAFHCLRLQGFANQITTVDEAKQFYPLFGLGANVALIFSGRAVRWFSEIRASA